MPRATRHAGLDVCSDGRGSMRLPERFRRVDVADTREHRWSSSGRLDRPSARASAAPTRGCPRIVQRSGRDREHERAGSCSAARSAHGRHQDTRVPSVNRGARARAAARGRPVVSSSRPSCGVTSSTWPLSNSRAAASRAAHRGDPRRRARDRTSLSERRCDGAVRARSHRGPTVASRNRRAASRLRAVRAGEIEFGWVRCPQSSHQASPINSPPRSLSTVRAVRPNTSSRSTRTRSRAVRSSRSATKPLRC